MIPRWKQKNQKLEKEVTKFKDLYNEIKLKNEAMTRELEQVRARDGVSFENLKRDFKELLVSFNIFIYAIFYSAYESKKTVAHLNVPLCSSGPNSGSAFLKLLHS